MFSTRICIIKEHWWSLASPWPNDVWKKFLGQPEMVLSTFIHRRFLDTQCSMMFITPILYLSYMFYTLFSTFRYSKLVSFTFYLVHLLSTWFTHSLISPLFRLSIDPTLLWRGGVSIDLLSRLFSNSIHWIVVY